MATEQVFTSDDGAGTTLVLTPASEGADNGTFLYTTVDDELSPESCKRPGTYTLSGEKNGDEQMVDLKFEKRQKSNWGKIILNTAAMQFPDPEEEE